MVEPPALLMVTWNRREYFERTIAHLLADPSEFKLYFWDNGSEDGVADLISELRDDRIVSRQLQKSNLGQFDAWHWFADNADARVIGKLDDDIRGPDGWMQRMAEMLVSEEQLGTLGGWVYLPSDWDEALAAHKVVNVGPYQIFRNGWVAGCIFCGRRDTLKRYSSTDRRQLGVPVQHMEMTRAGFINGYAMPIELAENLDDPRSPFCRMNRPGGWDQFAAYTARMRNFSGPKEYAEWIAEDARSVLVTSVQDQLRAAFPPWHKRLFDKVERRLKRLGAAI